MNPETLKALQESIAHHERLRDGVQGERTGPEGCSLCNLFNTEEMSQLQCCIGCPVYERTGKRFCEETPYYKQTDLFSRFDGAAVTRKRHGQKWIDVCQEEIDFLKSLLP